MSKKIISDENRKPVIKEVNQIEETADKQSPEVNESTEEVKDDMKEVCQDTSKTKTQAQGIGQVPLPGPGTGVKK